MKKFIITREQHGRRLDAVLKSLGLEAGLRGCRRLCADNLVFLNGRPATAATKAALGDELAVGGAQPQAGEAPAQAPQASAQGSGSAEAPCAVWRGEPPELVADFGDVIFVHKPAGLHSAALAGRLRPSLEAFLPSLAPRPGFALLARLDLPTSGLVAAACGVQAARRWRAAERAAKCLKFYCALLEGDLARPREVKNALDTARRLKTAVLPGLTPDFTRHTAFFPLALLNAEQAARLAPALPGRACGPGDGDDGGVGDPADRDDAANGPRGADPAAGRCAPPAAYTLAGCLIRRGARHQIRAHAAHMGHPLAGDALYGALSTLPPLLHHGRAATPFGTARRAAPAEDFLPPPALEALRRFWNFEAAPERIFIDFRENN